MSVEPFMTVARYPTESLAQDAAQLLVTHGVGATVAGVEDSNDGEAGAWLLQVLFEEVPRACEVLEVPEPEEYEPPERPGPPWKMLLIIWLIALLTLPPLAFWITISLAD